VGEAVHVTRRRAKRVKGGGGVTSRRGRKRWRSEVKGFASPENYEAREQKGILAENVQRKKTGSGNYQ